MPLPAGAFGGCRLLHVLVHIDGAVDHDEPDHRDRNKPDDQCCHVSSPRRPRIPLREPDTTQGRRGAHGSQAVRRGIIARKFISRFTGRPGNFKARCATQQKNSFGGLIALPKARAAQHKSSVNPICFEKLFGARIYSKEPLCAARSMLTLSAEVLKQLRCLNVG